jgi:Na+/H+ antiporter NhaD/arsenite permease-like protein
MLVTSVLIGIYQSCAKTCLFVSVCVYVNSQHKDSVGCLAEVSNNPNIFVAYNKDLFLTQFTFNMRPKNQFLLWSMLSSLQSVLKEQTPPGIWPFCSKEKKNMVKYGRVPKAKDLVSTESKYSVCHGISLLLAKVSPLGQGLEMSDSVTGKGSKQ